jgi:glutaredoxin-dependent peroxiredoxin
MALKPGDNLPDVTLPAHDNQPVSLAAYRGRPVVVLFFPLAFTDTCTAELCAVGEDFGAYEELGAEVLAISVDSPFVLARFRAECGAGFPFLSDFNREATAAFGVERQTPVGPGLRGVSERAAFVIGREGVITYAWRSTVPGQLPPFDEIKGALRALG